MRAKDRQWDNIGPNGIGLRLREGRWAQWMPPEELIIERMTTPPPTRALGRGKFIKASIGVQGSTVNWDACTINRHTLKMPDPKKQYTDEVDLLINECSH